MPRFRAAAPCVLRVRASRVLGPTSDMALPLLVHVRRLPAGGSTTDAAQGHMEVRTLQIVSGAGGEHPFTLTLALRADGLLVARCCDGRRRLGNRTPHALAQLPKQRL